MEYFPINSIAPDSQKRGRDMLIGSGLTKITGTKQYIYYSSIDNPIYDNYLQNILKTKDSLEIILEDVIKKIGSSLIS